MSSVAEEAEMVGMRWLEDGGRADECTGGLVSSVEDAGSGRGGVPAEREDAVDDGGPVPQGRAALDGEEMVDVEREGRGGASGREMGRAPVGVGVGSVNARAVPERGGAPPLPGASDGRPGFVKSKDLSLL